MDLPGVHDAANAASAKGQSSYLVLSGTRLVSVLVAALASALSAAFPLVPAFSWIVLLCFVAAALSELALIILQPERAWYAGRAIAESAKTLAWRFAVGGAAIPNFSFPGGSGVASEGADCRSCR